MACYKEFKISKEFLNENPNARFVFGDNTVRKGCGGAAKLRDHPSAIGFVTKKLPNNEDASFYKPEEYSPIFFAELQKLHDLILKNPDKTFYISKLGGGLANKYRIWDLLIHHNLVLKLEKFDNVIFCWL